MRKLNYFIQKSKSKNIPSGATKFNKSFFDIFKF